MPLEEFISKLSMLKTDRGIHRWSAETCHRAPHKPFLLLSIMDLIAQGLITENFIDPSFELVDTWNGYWNAIMPIGKKSSMAYPFYFMKSEGFWHPISCRAADVPRNFRSPSMIWVRENYSGARIEDELFGFLSIPETQEKLKAVLVSTYFSLEIQHKVIEQGYVNLASYKYSQTLINQEIVEQTALFNADAEPTKKKKIRDAGFRKAIVELYDHRCALCGIRMRTLEGHTVVEAAHIVPWSNSKDDKPTNGLCLCRLCHWSFDEGLMGVDDRYEVLVSDRVRIDSNMPGHIMTLAQRPIFKPGVKTFWPDQDNLNWHRSKRFS